MVCKPCEHATEFGWWGDTLPEGAATHCRVCHVSMPGTNVWGHCVKCHQTFRSISAFDRHQMLTDCPNIEGVVSDTAATVCDALRADARTSESKGKRHHLVQSDHPHLGYTFWAWAPDEERVL